MKGVAATLPTPGIGKIDHKSMFHNQWQLFRGQTKRFEEKSPSGDNPYYSQYHKNEQYLSKSCPNKFIFGHKLDIDSSIISSDFGGILTP